MRAPGRSAEVVHGDATELELEGSLDAILTSPPYPGLIDYHEQHRYAYEILGLDDRRERELGAAAAGTSRRAIENYTAGISAVSGAARSDSRTEHRCSSSSTTVATSTRRSSNERLRLVERLERHVNRRTGRRAGEYFESILVCVRET